MNEIIDFLHSLDLEDLEARVYIAALPFGTVPASVIANKLSIPRSTTRYTCDRLVEKRLMTESKRANTKLYTAENPTKLASLLYDREIALREKRAHLTNITQTLQKLYNPNTTLPEVTFYEGEDGVKKMFYDMADEPGDVYTLGAGDYFTSHNPELVKKFREKALRLDRKISIIRSLKYRELHTERTEKNYETRYFSHIEELKIDVQIRGETIGITSIFDNAPIGIHIKHKEIAEEFQKIFREIWNKSIQ